MLHIAVVTVYLLLVTKWLMITMVIAVGLNWHSSKHAVAECCDSSELRRALMHCVWPVLTGQPVLENSSWFTHGAGDVLVVLHMLSCVAKCLTCCIAMDAESCCFSSRACWRCQHLFWFETSQSWVMLEQAAAAAVQYAMLFV
jgi:hypothetical protein